MSKLQDIGLQVSHTCVGLLAWVLGDASGVARIAGGLGGLAAIGAALKGDCSVRAQVNAQRDVIDTLKHSHEFASVEEGPLLALFEDTSVQIDRHALIEANKQASDLDLIAQFTEILYGAMPFDGHNDATKRVARLALEAGLRACERDAAFKSEIRSVQLTHLVHQQAQDSAKLDRIEETVSTLSEQLAGKARELHLTEKLFIALARRVVSDVEDIDQAHRELERVVEVAAQQQQSGSLPADVDQAVVAVFDKVAQLNDAGRIDEAADLIADEAARFKSGLLNIYDKGIAQARMVRRPQEACDYELKKLDLQFPGSEYRFGQVRTIWNDWYGRGSDQGQNFDLQVAIELAGALVDVANGSDERGDSLNCLGLSQERLGDREASPGRLEQAVTAFGEALKEYTRERVPLGWAMTQHNLGLALRALGARENGVERLEQAVAAYEDALKERTRERVPLDWVMTQNNLGNALQALGGRESGTERLEQAVAAFEQALKERTRERVPLDWAATQNNLGGVLSMLGEQESGTDRIEHGVAAFQAALKENTRERVPLDWAATQNNLGNALRMLSERESGTERLLQARAAFEEALKERTRERMPLGWAATQNNLGNVLQALGERESGTERLEQAVAAYEEALGERTRERVPLDWAMTQNNLGKALSSLGERERGTERLEQALAAFEKALSIFTRDNAPHYWEGVHRNLLATKKLLDARRGDS